MSSHCSVLYGNDNQTVPKLQPIGSSANHPERQPNHSKLQPIGFSATVCRNYNHRIPPTGTTNHQPFINQPPSLPTTNNHLLIFRNTYISVCPVSVFRSLFRSVLFASVSVPFVWQASWCDVSYAHTVSCMPDHLGMIPSRSGGRCVQPPPRDLLQNRPFCF